MKLAQILFLICLAIHAPSCFGQLGIREGKDGIYIYLSDSRLSGQTPAQPFSVVNISRAIGKEDFKPLAQVQAAATPEEFKRIAGDGVLHDIRVQKNLKTEQEAWAFVKNNPKLADYGLIVLNPDFSVAMGAVYKDAEVKKSGAKEIRYRAEFISSDGKGNKVVDGNILIGTPPVIAKPELQTVLENDSSMVISWTMNQATSPDVMLGQIWLREKANAPFRQTGYAFANREEKDGTITFTWQQPVKPGLSYGLYLEPQTLPGLAGPLSDTISLISRSFRNLAQIPIASVRDTSNGIYISWKTVDGLSFLGGIVIERSKLPSEGFSLLDTIPATATSYTDQRVLPNVLYHYRFRMLSMRGSWSEPSAYVSHRMFVKKRPIEAPEQLKIIYSKTGNAVLIWKPVPSPEVSGYQVFRTLQGSDQFEQISNLLPDSVFTDTTVHNSRLVYKYAVRTINYENRTSELSKVVFGSPAILILPKTPYDVEGYAEPGKVTLRWKDMVAYDPYIRGYTVYRKALGAGAKPKDAELSAQALQAEGYRKLNQVLTTEVVFADKTLTPGISYAYAVTATDQFGVEGNALTAKKMETPKPTLRSPEIYARPTSKGIEITWNDVLVPGVDKYLLFVRQPGQKEPTLLAEIQTGKEVYINTTAKPGQQYFYTMQISGKGLKSQSGFEKSARRD
jgi:fibronectin type 3 domain-containing protein